MSNNRSSPGIAKSCVSETDCILVEGDFVRHPPKYWIFNTTRRECSRNYRVAGGMTEPLRQIQLPVFGLNQDDRIEQALVPREE